MVYSNHIKLNYLLKKAFIGWSKNYTAEERQLNRYRDVNQKIAHLRSFKTQLYLKIKEADLKDEAG